MQKVNVICVGKLKEKFYMEAVGEYEKRLQRHCKLSILELTEQRLWCSSEGRFTAEIRF